MNESLWKLYTKEDTKGMRSLIEHGANPNCYGLIKKALLHKAAESGKVQMAKVLLENGAEPNIQDLYQRTPLHFAAENGHTDVVRVLLEYKADVSATDMKGVSALMIGSLLDIIELLIFYHTDVKLTDRDGQTALHIAASRGKCDIVKTLLKHGADHSAKDNKGNTPIVYAINNGHNDVVKALIDAGVNVNERVLFFGGDSTLLHHAVETKNVEIVKTLLDHGHPVNAVDHGKWAAFDSACVAGLPDIVELMLERGANVDHVVGVMKRVSLHHAVDSESSNLKVVELLLKHSDVNVQDEDGLTPIYYAANRGHIQIFLLLLKQGADLKKCGSIDFHTLIKNSLSKKQVNALKIQRQSEFPKTTLIQKSKNDFEEELTNCIKILEQELSLSQKLLEQRDIMLEDIISKSTINKQKQHKQLKSTLTVSVLITMFVLFFGFSILINYSQNEKEHSFSDIQSIVSTSFTATGGYSSRLDWIKYGIEIDIPENALPSNVSAEITVYVSLFGPFIFPDSDIWKMASPIYWIYTNNSRNFIKPIQLGLLHTARNFTNPFQLRMVSTDDNSGNYVFEKRINGHHISNRSYFSYVYLNEFSGYCIQVRQEVVTATKGRLIHENVIKNKMLSYRLLVYQDIPEELLKKAYYDYSLEPLSFDIEFLDVIQKTLMLNVSHYKDRSNELKIIVGMADTSINTTCTINENIHFYKLWNGNDIKPKIFKVPLIGTNKPKYVNCSWKEMKNLL